MENEIVIQNGKPYKKVPFLWTEQIVIEKPRVRSVLLNRKHVRLAFPWVVRKEITTPHAVDQRAWVSPDAPTWISPLYQFPLTWHKDKENAMGVTVPGAMGSVEDYSHYGETGRVCYDHTVFEDTVFMHAIAIDPSLALWGTNHVHWDREYVERWAVLTKEDVQKATTWAIRGRPMDFRPHDIVQSLHGWDHKGFVYNLDALQRNLVVGKNILQQLTKNKLVPI